MDELIEAIYTAIDAADELTVAEAVTALELVKFRLLSQLDDLEDDDE